MVTRPPSVDQSIWALDAAIDLYTHIYNGQFKVYEQAKYRFRDPDLAKIRDIADGLRKAKRKLIEG